MSESSDYKTFKDNCPDPLDRIDRIENMIGVGAPDVNFCIAGVDGWFELKSPTEPKRATTPLFGSNHKLTIDQRNWFLRQRNARGRAFILIATDKRWMLIEGKYADFINKLPVSGLLQISIWNTTRPVKEKKTWKQLRALLIV